MTGRVLQCLGVGRGQFRGRRRSRRRTAARLSPRNRRNRPPRRRTRRAALNQPGAPPSPDAVSDTPRQRRLASLGRLPWRDPRRQTASSESVPGTEEGAGKHLRNSDIVLAKLHHPKLHQPPQLHQLQTPTTRARPPPRTGKEDAIGRGHVALRCAALWPHAPSWRTTVRFTAIPSGETPS